MMMWVVDMVFKTATLSPNGKIQVHLRILMMRLIRVMVIWVVGIVFKTATLITNAKIQVPSRILVGMFTRVVLLVYMVIWKAILIYNIMFTIFSREGLRYDMSHAGTEGVEHIHIIITSTQKVDNVILNGSTWNNQGRYILVFPVVLITLKALPPSVLTNNRSRLGSHYPPSAWRLL